VLKVAVIGDAVVHAVDTSAERRVPRKRVPRKRVPRKRVLGKRVLGKSINLFAQNSVLLIKYEKKYNALSHENLCLYLLMIV
jgi:ribosomal protein L14